MTAVGAVQRRQLSVHPVPSQDMYRLRQVHVLARALDETQQGACVRDNKSKEILMCNQPL